MRVVGLPFVGISAYTAVVADFAPASVAVAADPDAGFSGLPTPGTERSVRRYFDPILVDGSGATKASFTTELSPGEVENIKIRKRLIVKEIVSQLIVVQSEMKRSEVGSAVASDIVLHPLPEYLQRDPRVARYIAEALIENMKADTKAVLSVVEGRVDKGRLLLMADYERRIFYYEIMKDIIQHVSCRKMPTYFVTTLFERALAAFKRDPERRLASEECVLLNMTRLTGLRRRSEGLAKARRESVDPGELAFVELILSSNRKSQLWPPSEFRSPRDRIRIRRSLLGAPTARFSDI